MLKKLLRSVSVVLALALVFSILTCAPFSVSAAETDDLAAVAAEPEELFGEPSGGKYTLESATYQLSADYALEGYLYVPSGVTAEIDLNGHTIDRGLTSSSTTGYVIKNEGTLTITDTSGSSGKITGGYAKQGGAVNNSGTLTIEHGSFVNNRASQEAGAVLNDTGATLTVNGGNFAYNSTGQYGGGAFVNFGTMTISGGTITGNTAAMDAGAIFNADNATLYLYGGTVTGNYAGLKAGGIYNSALGTLYMGHSPVVKDNANGNLWLGGDSVITKDPQIPITNNAAIDVRADNMTESRAITTGFNFGNTDMFSFAYGATWAKCDESGEVIPDIAQTVTVNTWDELKTAVGTDNAVIALGQDITNPTLNASDPIKITGKNVYIDLMGYTIDRNRTTSHDDGHVIWASDDSTVTILDTVGGGMITGGYATNGGGINVAESAELNLYNVTVTGNSANDGGAIFVHGKLNINGAVIKDNNSNDDGGAIHFNEDALSADIKNAVIASNHGNGSGNDSQAGAIYQNSGVTTTIENTYINGNDSNKKGGAIYVRWGSINMTGGSVSNNTSTDGGGVYVTEDTTFTANGTVFSGNEATTGCGGAVYDEGSLTLTDCTVTGNSAATWGGGVYLADDTDASLNLNGGRVENNTCVNNGGGVHVSATAYMTVSGAPVVKNNKADNNIVNNIRLTDATSLAVSETLTDGAQIGITAKYYDRALVTGLASEADMAYFTMDDTSESNEFTKTFDNGSMVVKKVSKVTVDSWSAIQTEINRDDYDKVIVLGDNITANSDQTRIRIHDNKNIVLDLNGKTLSRGRTSKDTDGHVIEVHDGGVLTVRDSVGGGVITGGWATNGGGINVNDGGTLTLESGTISGNKAENGGGVHVKKGGAFTMSGGTIDSNTAADGAGVYVADDSAVFTMSGGTISNNTASDEGGGIYTDYKLTVEGGTISGNKAKYGGGIYYDDNRISITIKNATIKENTASTKGSAIYLQAGTITMTDCTISNNTSADGTVYVTSSTTLNATGTTFKSNKVTGYSGGAIVNKGTVTLTDCNIASNTVYKNGGGVWSDEKLTINNSTFTKNRTNNGCGGAIYVQDGTLNLYGATINDGNIAESGGSGVYIESDATLNMKGKVIISENSGTNLFLENGRKINLKDALTDDSSVYVAIEKNSATITNDYNTYHPGTDPETFFTADEGGSSVILDSNGEAMIVQSKWSELQKLIADTANGGTLTLNRDWEATSGDTHIEIPADKSITIDLNGYTIDAKKNFTNSIFDVKGTLTVKDTSADHDGKITGGNCNKGGAIYIFADGTFNLESGAITGNTAKSDGSAIYNISGGTLNISGGTVEKNTAKFGAVFNAGTMTVSGGTIAENTATNSGGGIYNTGTVNITGGAIQNNTAEETGGGIYNIGTVNMTGGSITGNSALKDAGGIYNYGALKVKNAPVIENNTAAIGNNILLDNSAKITLTGALQSGAKLDVVTTNTSQPLTQGYNTYHGSVTITYNGKDNLTEVKSNELYYKNPVTGTAVSTWTELQNAINSATEGQVLVLTADAVCDNNTRLIVDGKTVTIDLNGHKIDRARESGTTSNGQVFDVKGGAKLTISDASGAGIITGGYSKHGGGFYIDDGSTVTITGGSVWGNKADSSDGGDGGGFYIEDGTLVMTGGSIAFNRADDTGGGIYCKSDGTIKLENALITGNYSDDDDGGGMNLHLKDNSSYIKNCVISNNECGENNGGGFRLDAKGKILTVENTRIENNTADEDGGGFYITEGTVSISDSFVNNNIAEDDGGGAYTERKTTLNANNTVFSGNSSSDDGGGVNIRGFGTMTNCKVNENHSGDSGAGIYILVNHKVQEEDGYHYEPDEFTITGSDTEICDNVAGGGGGGMKIQSGILTMNGGTVARNSTVMGDGGGIYVNEEYHSYTNKDTLVCSNVTFEANEAGTEKVKREEYGGGGVFVDNWISAKITNCTFKDNWGKYDGGGVEVENDAKAVIEDSTFTGNACVQHGTAIHVRDRGDIYLKNVKVTGNEGNHAVWVNEDLHVSGKIEIYDNEGDDLFLNDDEPLVLDSELAEGSRIGVVLEDGDGTFTENYKKYHEGEDPLIYFYAGKDGYSIKTDKKGEAKVVASDWIDLQKSFNDASGETTIQLTKDYKASDCDKTLTIASGKSIILDLNGHTIDGKEEVGTVFKVESGATLTIKDTTADQKGTITGGTHSGIENYGTMTFAGGTITGNRASSYGGGIDNRGTLTMSGGVISGNVAGNGGGIYNDGTLNLYGGKIEKNTADCGGGIFVAEGSTLKTHGEPTVKGNDAAAGKNILLSKNTVIKIDERLSNEARLDVATKDYQYHQTNPLTNGYSVYCNDLAVFSYNEDENINLRCDGSELYVDFVFDYDVEVGSWQELQAAVNNSANDGKIIALTNDLGETGQERIEVENGRNITIELAGYTMNRARTSKTDQGNVFKVSGSGTHLTIRDSIGTGTVTGGYANGDGGGFYIVDGAKLTIESGSVVGNKASSDGAGIFVDGATLEMTGGSVSGNSSADNGGGIYTTSDAKISLANAKITRNTSENGGGGLNIHLKENAAIENCLIAYNRTEDSDGAGLSFDSSGKTLTIKNTNILSNTADDEGGGIFIDGGTVVMDGGKIDGNTSDDGGGVYITSKDKLIMQNSAVISNNKTTGESGGGITCHGFLEINNATVEKNYSAKNGGGVFYQNSGKEITLTNAKIKDNEAKGDGGGLYIKQGTVTLSGGEISGNKSVDGGGVFVTDDTEFNATGTTIKENYVSKEDGGGIVNKGDTTLTNCTIQDNKAHDGGGGIWSDDDITIDSCTITGNKTIAENGGGICMVDGDLKLYGSNTITDNDAGACGSGIFVDDDTDDIYIKDTLIVKDNNGNNIYLVEDKLVVDGKLNASSAIWVTLEDETGKFTEDYTAKENTADPSTIFFSDDDFDVILEDGEAALFFEEFEDENPFISRDENIADSDKVSGKNWMSGLSGERYLNEINLPRAHDAAMHNVLANYASSDLSKGLVASSVGVGAIAATLVFAAILTVASGGTAAPLVIGGLIAGSLAATGAILNKVFINKAQTNAQTQYRYIDEMMVDGVREFDIRLNNKTYEERYSTEDDGKNLYLCHGKSNIGGTYQGCDHDGNPLTLNKVLNWAKEFLKKHPTEVIEFTFSVETTTAEKDTPIVDERLATILKEFSREINPSTGKPYLYMEDGVFKKQYSVPQLKDCRGQIVCGRLTDESAYPCMTWSQFTRYNTGSSSVIALPEQRVEQTMEALKNHPSPLILTDALVHRDFESGLFVNTTDDENKLLDCRSPLDCAEEVLFGARDGSFEGVLAEGGEINQTDGKFFGRFGADGYTRSVAKTIWKTNFHDSIQYRTITVKSSANDQNPKVYKVLKGTVITVPDCIYDNPQNGNNYFQNWSVTSGDNGDRMPDYAIQDDNPNRDWLMSKSYLVSTDDAITLDTDTTEAINPGDKLCVMDDLTVVATWGSDIKTPVTIVWNDANDADGLRPEALDISFTNTGDTEAHEATVYADAWKTTITGDTATVVPVGDLLGDEAIGYRYTVTGEKAAGFTITMYHAPQTTVTAAGTVYWDDGDNIDGKRPDSVTIHLYKNGEELQSTTATGAENWSYSFGTMPLYEDYEEVVYTVSQDAVDEYSSSADGFSITNVYYPPEKSGVSVQVVWEDSYDAAGERPESVKVVLKNGSEQVAYRTVSDNAKSNYGFAYFDTAKYETEHEGETFNYTVEIEDLPASYVSQAAQDEYGTWIITNTYQKDGYFQGHSLSLKGDIGVNFFVDLTAEELSDAKVSFKWFDKSLEVEVTGDMLDEKTGFYKVTCPVAVAEMTYDITAALIIGDEEKELDRYSVTKYADVILTDKSFRDCFIEAKTTELGSEDKAEEKFTQLVTLVLTMLDYGSMAQLAFDRDTGNLANGLDKGLFNNPVTTEDIMTDADDMTEGLEAYGLDYVGTTVVYLSQTSLRHYYTVTDEALFNEVKDSILFNGQNVTYKTKNGQIYFERKNISATNLSTQYVLKIGENEYRYSVLDYVKACLDSTKVSDKTKDLVKATYRYNDAAKTYFG